MKRAAGMTLVEMLVAIAVLGIVITFAYVAIQKFGNHQDVETRRQAAMDTSKLLSAKMKRRFVDRHVAYSGMELSQTVSPGYTLPGGCGTACPGISIDFTDPKNIASTVTMTATTACRAKPPGAAYAASDFTAVGKACIACGAGQIPFVTLSYSDGRAAEVYPQGGKANGGAKIAAGVALCVQPLPGSNQIRFLTSSAYVGSGGLAKVAEDDVTLTTNLQRNMQLIK